MAVPGLAAQRLLMQKLCMRAGYGNTRAQQEPWQAAGFCWALRAARRQYGRPPFTPEQLALITELVQVTVGRVSAPVTAMGLAPEAETKLPQHCFLSLTGTGRGEAPVLPIFPTAGDGVDLRRRFPRSLPQGVSEPRSSAVLLTHVHGRSRRAAAEAH